MNLPSFFIDDSESMKFEETIDFFMSWTIRCADEIHQNGNKKVYENSRKIVCNLLGLEYTVIQKFSNIKVWKQHKNIDLWVELSVNNERYALIIEDKMYSSIHSDQLTRYKIIVEDYYLNNPPPIIQYVLLRPDYELALQDKDLITNSDFKYYNLEQIADVLDTEKTGNELFDEFWYNWTKDSQAKR
tara:strand:- start:1256 stop:1816 length:561 start_codon:yes stop_codon:yes gene_type:complete